MTKTGPGISKRCSLCRSKGHNKANKDCPLRLFPNAKIAYWRHDPRQKTTLLAETNAVPTKSAGAKAASTHHQSRIIDLTLSSEGEATEIELEEIELEEIELEEIELEEIELEELPTAPEDLEMEEPAMEEPQTILELWFLFSTSFLVL